MPIDVSGAADVLCYDMSVVCPPVKRNAVLETDLGEVWQTMPLSGWLDNATESLRIKKRIAMTEYCKLQYVGRSPGRYGGQAWAPEHPALLAHFRKLEKLKEKKKENESLDENTTEEQLMQMVGAEKAQTDIMEHMYGPDAEEIEGLGVQATTERGDDEEEEEELISHAMKNEESAQPIDQPIIKSPHTDKKRKAKDEGDGETRNSSEQKGSKKTAKKVKIDEDINDEDVKYEDESEYQPDTKDASQKKTSNAADKKEDMRVAEEGRALSRVLISVRGLIAEGVHNAYNNDHSSPYALSENDQVIDYESSTFNLRPHQRDGVGRYEYMIEKFGAVLLADDMGLGKTAIVIAHLQREVTKARAANRSVIFGIVVPRSLVSNWKVELSASSLRYCDYSEHSLTARQFETQYDVLLIPNGSLSHAYRQMRQAWIQWEAAKEGLLEQLNELSASAGFSPGNTDFHRRSLAANGIHYDELILEEAHHVKNFETELAQSTQLLSSSKRVAITGTPLQNDVSEFGALLYFLMLKPWNDPDIYRAVFLAKQTRRLSDYMQRLNRENDAVLGAIRSAISIRHEKNQLFNGEPILDVPKSRDIFCQVAMSADTLAQQKKLKDVWDIPFRRRRERKYQTSSKNDKHKYKRPTHKKIFKTILECQWHVVHPRLVKAGYSGADESMTAPSKLTQRAKKNSPAEKRRIFRENMRAAPNMWRSDRTCAVVGQVEKILAKHEQAAKECSSEVESKIYRSEHKFLVFSEFISALDILEIGFERRGIKTLRFDGSITPADRDVIRRRFEEEDEDFKRKDFNDPNVHPDEVQVMLISNKTGFEGLNLVHASEIVIVAPTWNPSVEDQLIARAARKGQKHIVRVWRFYAHDSIERRILSLQTQKRTRVDRVMQDSYIRTHAKAITNCNDARLEDILGYGRCMRAITRGALSMI